MTTMFKLVATAAVSIAAGLPALAEETKAATEAQPIPTLRCEFKSVNACVGTVEMFRCAEETFMSG